MQKKNLLVWLDLEMTGLDPTINTILEIATIITDMQLVEIATGPVIAIYQPESVLATMDDWNIRHHTKSGLLKRVKASKTTIQQAQNATLAFIQQYVLAKQSPLCGNSIATDRKFLAAYMPKLEEYFHYRILDVSSIKILAKSWYPEIAQNMIKESKHQALSDIRDSIDELRYYRKTIFI